MYMLVAILIIMTKKCWLTKIGKLF